MGAEESKSSRYNNQQRQSQQNVSREELNRLLEQQKRDYERKLRELQIRTANSAQSSESPVAVSRELLSRNADDILGQQLQEFVQITFNDVQSTNSTQRCTTTPNVQVPNSESRNGQKTTKYSYTSDELRKIQKDAEKEKQQPLYPKLDNNVTDATRAFQENKSVPIVSFENNRTPVRNIPVYVDRSNSSVEPINNNNEEAVNKTTQRYQFPADKPGPSSTSNTASTSQNNNNSFAQKPFTSRNQFPAEKPGPSFTSNTASTSQNNNNSFAQKPFVSRNQFPAEKPGPSFTSNNRQNNKPLPFAPKPSTSRDHFPADKPGTFSTSQNNDHFAPKPSTSRVQPSAPPESEIETKRSTSKSPSRKTQAKKKTAIDFKCITCGNKYGLNIFQCGLGHSSCRDCKLRSRPCGLCNQSIGDMRNIALETILAGMKLTETASKAAAKTKCPNHAEGCTYCCKQVELDKHLKECPFRELDCPLQTLFGSCTWRGKISQLNEHFGGRHPENCQGNVGTEMYLINVVDNNHNVYFVEMAPFHFLVHVKVDENERKVFMTAQLFGTQVSASKWTYEIQVYNKREPRRKFVHVDICSSSAKPVDEIFADMNCATLPLAYALTFINEGCLTYKFYIKKECDDVSFKGKRGRGCGRGRGARDQPRETTGLNDVSLNSRATNSDQNNANESTCRLSSVGITPKTSMLSFKFVRIPLKLNLLMALDYLGIREPTEFQEYVMPCLLQNPSQNVIIRSTSGTGKSTALVLALMNKVNSSLKHPQIMYVCPSNDVVTDVVRIITNIRRNSNQNFDYTVMKGQTSKISEQILLGIPEKIIFDLRYESFDIRNINTFIVDNVDFMHQGSVELITNFLGSSCQIIYLTALKKTVEYFGTRLPNCTKMEI